MGTKASGDFVRGLAAGAGLSLALVAGILYLPSVLASPLAQTLWSRALDAEIVAWVKHNLGYSLVPFSLSLVLFQRTLSLLQRRLNDKGPPDRVAQLDQLSDIWIGLFFGIGVLWTAIGMRSALLYGLGDGATAMAAGGPAGLLDRLVRGGILTALTTTVVGGAGGYLLRLYKTVRVGGALKRYYGELERHRQQRVEGLLREIRDRPPPTAQG